MTARSAAAATMTNGQTQTLDLEYWMSDLPVRLREEPIIYLAIPGSHDSMSYGINSSSQIAPDSPPALSRLFPFFRGTIIRWSLTQAVDVIRQLEIGIRYFDLRIASKRGTDSLYYTHGLYAGEVRGPLKQIKEFLDLHQQEVVILDFQHFYNVTASAHQRLIDALVNILGSKICPRKSDLTTVTLNSMHRLNQQVIIVYRHRSVYSSELFWRPEQLPTPWPRADTVPELTSFLSRIKRHPGTGFVHQAVLTPTTSFILLRWISSVRDTCAIPVLQHVVPKLRDLLPGPPARPPAGQPAQLAAPVNVVIADFVELKRAEFPQTIVGLNYKLLERIGSNNNRDCSACSCGNNCPCPGCK